VNRADRDDLARVARMRVKLGKTKAKEREKVLLAEAEDLLSAEYDARDDMWAEATKLAQQACAAANERIQQQCAVLGIPARFAPQLDLRWYGRWETGSKDRRAELRKLATTRLAALTAAAVSALDEWLVDTETALIADGLESDEARTCLERMPTAERLMPPLSLSDLGVKRWQPPEGAAAELLTPSTPAARRRQRIARTIAANPAASDRKIAELVGVDHKTVAAHRRANGGEPAGELPTAAAEAGEFPTSEADGVSLVDDDPPEDGSSPG
jgi:hypothetical protein